MAHKTPFYKEAYSSISKENFDSWICKTLLEGGGGNLAIVLAAAMHETTSG